ncbi:5-hydroxytryptamine receptor 2A isoform X1 [Diachasma alloeum]|uniref:5-hydroxytryptamine receptor 2A isoform X1 n=1 Tax=Diachasma alloeum TaxID=454923 RepID=UPI0007383C83|nr:5-hydroxytryptamine receptor 2A isoform X1 [Diachasma alloeum]XP_015113988.1 5-hydroxytryptamine receptor 2A isoform X1 [Diachasma alloeum]XP_015113989.1 5-hydroxytryptamine receptor 2A isoform X1 [Diachasma alloeum]
MAIHSAGNRTTTDHGLPLEEVTMVLTGIFLGLLILITIVGNVFVIAAILLDRNLQSVANYLIISLAVADLMVACLVMPLSAVYEINSGWSLGPELCDIWTSSDVLCCTASILHLVAIAIDRYWAVTDIKNIQGRNPKRISLLIVGVWIVSLVVSLAPQFGWKDPAYMERIAQGKCLVSQDPAYQIFATCATFYVPLLAILFLYWRIFQEARKRIRKRPGTKVHQSRQGNGLLKLVKRRTLEESTAFTITRSTPEHSSASPEKTSYDGSTTVQATSVSTTITTISTTMGTIMSTASTAIVVQSSQPQIITKTIEAKRERKAAKTLAIITGAFVACWFPFFFVTLLQAICTVCYPPELLASVFLWLGYFNSTLNPIIYTIFSPEFRLAFKKMLCMGTRSVAR